MDSPRLTIGTSVWLRDSQSNCQLACNDAVQTELSVGIACIQISRTSSLQFCCAECTKNEPEVRVMWCFIGTAIREPTFALNDAAVTSVPIF